MNNMEHHLNFSDLNSSRHSSQIHSSRGMAQCLPGSQTRSQGRSRGIAFFGSMGGAGTLSADARRINPLASGRIMQALCAAGLLVSTLQAQALTQDELVAQSGYEYHSSAEDRRTAAALNKARQRSADLARRTPLQVSNDSQVRLVYGSGMHTVLTTPLHLTAIVLEPGEQIISMDVGARESWSINRTVSGSDAGIVEQVIIKPFSSGMHTNMLISTDRRMYHLTLKSTEKDYMPLVSFIYPQSVFENVQAQRDLLSQKMNHSAIATSAHPEGVDPAALDFAYEIEGDSKIQPLRVFNDGLKTYIKMPEQVMKGRLPALVVVHSSGMMSDDEIAVTNYRIRNDSFVVDGIPDHMRLILGNEKNGSHLSVDITRS